MANNYFENVENDNTEEIWWAPVEIEHADQLETLNATKEDCKTWRIGTEKIIVYLVPSNKATYDFLLGELRKKHRNGYRSVRCKIPGTQKPLIICPDTNKCANCPYGRRPADRDPNEISWEELTDSGYEITTYDSTSNQALAKAELNSLLDKMVEEDPKIEIVFKMRRLMGFDALEIAALLGLSEAKVYRLLRRADAISKANYTE